MNPHTPPSSRRCRVLAAPFVALCLATAAFASDFNYVPNGTNTWNTAVWSSAAVPGPTHNYIVANGQVLRTTDLTSSTFGGGSLTVNGQLNLQAGNANSNSANFILRNGAVMVNAKGPSTQTVAGTLSLGSGIHYVRSTGTTADYTGSGGANSVRNITFTALVSGGTDSTAHFLRNGTFTLGNAANTFAGTWRAGGSASIQVDGAANITVSNNSTITSTLKAAAAGSLGINSSVALDAWSRFDADFDWTTTGSLTLASNGGSAASVIVTLDQDFTVGLLSIAGTELAAGTYGYADLVTAGFGDYFTDGAGSITVSVIPEPSASASLLGFAALALAARFSRRRS